MRRRRLLKLACFLVLVDGVLLFAAEAVLGWCAPPYHRQVAQRLTAKPAATRRLFLFGESTVYGFPYGEGNSTARWLEEVLHAAGAGPVEVVNFGRPARGSFHLDQAVKETLYLRPDGVILCTGHNEFLARALSLAESPRHRWCYFHVNAYRLGYDRLAEWRSRQEARTGGAHLGDGIVPGSPLAERALAHYVMNVDRMISRCQEHGVPVLVVLPAANLAWPPMYAPRDSRLAADQRQRISVLLAAAEQRLRQGADASELLAEAAQLCPDDAAVQYALGCQARQAGDARSARAALERARDLDRLPFRCQGPFQAAVTSLCQRRGVALVHLPEKFAQLPGSPVGMAWFIDNCHPRPWGQHFMACEMVRGIAAAGWLKSLDVARLPEWQKVAAHLTVDWQSCERAAYFSLLQLHPELAAELAARPPAGLASIDAEWLTFELLAWHRCGRAENVRRRLAELGGWPAVTAAQLAAWPGPVRDAYAQARLQLSAAR